MDRNIHLFWMQGEPHLIKNYPKLYSNMDSWRGIYKDYNVYTWDYNSLTNLIKNEYSYFLPYFYSIESENLSNLHILVKQMDFAKWFVLHKYGGMYVDRDMVALKSIEPTIQSALHLHKNVVFSLEKIKESNFKSKIFHTDLYSSKLINYNFIYQDAWSYHSKNNLFGLDFIRWVIDTEKLKLPVFDSFSIISLTEFILNNKKMEVFSLDYDYVMRGDMCDGWSYHTFEGGWT